MAQAHVNAFDLTGKTAIVTGSGRGLGRRIAEGLAAAGANLVVCARSEDEALRCAASIRESGGSAHAVRADVTDDESCAAVVDCAVSVFGGVHVLVNNAGIELLEAAERLPADIWQRTLATNLQGAATCARLAAEQMDRAGGGSIINISSIASTVAMPRALAYGASKAALNQLTRVLALEWAPRGIRVNAVAPGYMENEMRGGFTTDIETVRAVTPLGRRGRAEELVGPVVFLASEASSYVTGAVLFVDGGTTAV
jgi:NAD(P)-dependent dehydrogenase (short-subunit alcohol dehydrogenase family)